MVMLSDSLSPMAISSWPHLLGCCILTNWWPMRPWVLVIRPHLPVTRQRSGGLGLVVEVSRAEVEL